mmetsp:Transcript_30299/g.39111  ORF Transcript_30299/g.39111 Transcript_30299/m.39111 type:complete len:859 (-) Transcript_30299:377-2953(-)
MVCSRALVTFLFFLLFNDISLSFKLPNNAFKITNNKDLHINPQSPFKRSHGNFILMTTELQQSPTPTADNTDRLRNNGNGRPQRGRGGGHQNGGRGRPQPLQLEAPKRIMKVGGRAGGRSDGNRGRGGGGRGGGGRQQQSQVQGDSSSESNQWENQRSSPSSGGGAGAGAAVADMPSSRPGAAPRRNFGADKKKGGAYIEQRRDVEGKPRGGGKRGGKRSRYDDDIFGEMANRRTYTRKKKGTKKKGETIVKKEDLPVVLNQETYTVGELAEKMYLKPAEVVKHLMLNMGVMATVTQSLDLNTCIKLAEAYGRTVSSEEIEDDDDEEGEEDDEIENVTDTGIAIDEDDPESLLPRAPVVTIMGHVDHGKTSLLDSIRETRVTASEAGGITQHIGAYQVDTVSGQKITFIDTPGHAAFSAMRARGANVTDIVILVVAADDGVMEQTADSIACAKQAEVPIVVAYNKIDKETADVQKVKNELMQYELLMEEYGGDVMGAEVSAKQKLNLDELLEKVLLQAELLDLKANPNRDAQGVVIEAKIEKGLGAVGTTLIQRGTIRVGDIFLAGASWGKVRALIDTEGKRIKEAGPSTPVQVVGFNSAPLAGDTLLVVDSEQTARQIAEARSGITKDKSALQLEGDIRSNLKAIFETGEALDGIEKKTVNVVIKADVQGSAEALADSLSTLKVSDEIGQVTVKVLSASAGDVTKSDIALASVSDALVIAFNVAANYEAQEEARTREIDIMYASIVYDVLDEMQERIQETLSPTPDGEYVGKARVKQVFDIGKVGKIAGCEVLDGRVKKGANVRVMRGPRVIFEGELKTLKNLKADADEMVAGTECGIALDSFEDFLEDDFIECYVL